MTMRTISPMETDIEMTKMMIIANKDLKLAIINMLKKQRKI